MKIKRLYKAAFALWCTTALLIISSVCASADSGPKPSVHVTFENLGDELCYATLLSSTESTGPSSVWDGNEENARHNENPNGQYDWQEFGYKIWKAFVDYGESDDFFFLQEAWQINETKELAWTYYPPEEFKILLYFPETGEYAVSGVYERYAFDSYYTVNMEGASLFVDCNKALEAGEKLTAFKSYDYSAEVGSLAARIFITVIIETAIALLFGYREKKQLLLLVCVNGGTQIILNVLLNILNYNSGETAFVVFYVLLELLVSAIEAIFFYYLLNRYSIRQRPKWLAVVYALAANAASFLAGMLIAQWLPGIF